MRAVSDEMVLTLSADRVLPRWCRCAGMGRACKFPKQLDGIGANRSTRAVAPIHGAHMRERRLYPIVADVKSV
jgi:hypothetical protein